MTTRIGFIGLGAMGLPMAVNLMRAGHDVVGYDINAGCVKRYANDHGGKTGSLAEIVAHSEIVFTMLPAGEHVQKCVRELVDAGLKDRIIVDFSTIGVEAARAAHAYCAGHGLRLLDAPVTGGVIGAERGTLTIMVGGSEADFERIRPLLQAMGKTVTLAGGPSCGQAIKVCNNMASGIIKIAISEAFALARKLGVDEKILFDVAAHGSANCFALTSTCPVPSLVPSAPSSHNYAGGFAARLMLKDMKLAQDAAAAYGVPVTVASVATSLYEHCVSAGLGDLDNSIVFKFITHEYQDYITENKTPRGNAPN